MTDSRRSRKKEIEMTLHQCQQPFCVDLTTKSCAFNAVCPNQQKKAKQKLLLLWDGDQRVVDWIKDDLAKKYDITTPKDVEEAITKLLGGDIFDYFMMTPALYELVLTSLSVASSGTSIPDNRILLIADMDSIAKATGVLVSR